MRCMGRGKWYWIAGVVVMAMLLFAGPAIGYYDDFDDAAIDPANWLFLEGGSKVVNVDEVSGVLVKNNRAVDRNARHKVFLVDPGSANNSFKASVKITDISPSTTNVYSCTRLEGVFFNVNENPDSSEGDVWLAVCIGDRGSGLETWYEASENTTDDWSGYRDYDSVQITNLITINNKYQLEIGTHSRGNLLVHLASQPAENTT